ncbi:MAG: bifunctional DNA-formamidopyrimidine glycosylase/DNA-(apurinic or apyrimidinic site) lyase [Candidatus Nomurabacteria bacterium]|jgi:formamidopyrimidine-DNA glycosylase|nr:bifunctional DNA-formamidopyrimidine glycosylase/DNA-(apurinic or apyrimidinic site) lyase [Candidatus Nomurabacteria bacterium]
MPELPEVETIRRGLEKLIIGKAVAKITIFEKKSFIGDKKMLGNQKITALARRGKALIIGFGGGVNLLVHLRMTGQLVYVGAKRWGGGHPTDDFLNDLPSKHTRVMVEFDDGSHLYFNDQRKFGFIKVLLDKEIENDSFIKRLGADALGEDFGWQDLKRQLATHQKSKIKAALLDQTVVAGVGNIYADESLFFASVHPERLAGSLSDYEIEKIWRGVRETMRQSIKSGGSSLKNYVKADGKRGDYLDLFAKVFHKEGSNCPRCQTKIIKIKVCGRGTHLCPNCQKLVIDDKSRSGTRNGGV